MVCETVAQLVFQGAAQLGWQPVRIPRGRGGRGDGGKNVSARQPQQVGKATTIGMAGAVNPFGVHVIILLEPAENGVKEFEVAVSFITQRRLPAGLISLPVSQLTRRVQSLHVNDNGFGPFLFDLETVCRLLCAAAVTMEDEHERRRIGFGCGWNINERDARRALYGKWHGLKGAVGR